MKILRSMAAALLMLLPLTAGTAFADTGHGYSRMFVFGASFLDPGNHFAITGETAHPPFYPITSEHFPPSYGVGGHRFTNGRTWVEVMAQEMELTEWAKPAYRDPAFGNYALGAARALPVDDPIMPGLGQQVQDWIANGYCSEEPLHDTLFVVDTIYFDFHDIISGADPYVVLPAMAASIGANIDILYDCGARNLMVANVVPIGASPAIPDDATTLAAMYNLIIREQVVGYYSNVMNMNITIADFFTFGALMLGLPEDFGFTNITDTCVTFGVVQGPFCKQRNGYFFWDPLHPSKQVHQLLGEFALTQLPDPD